MTINSIRPAVLAALTIMTLTCKPAAVNWEAFDEQTIEKDLAALESAADVYFEKLQAGDIDAAAQLAQAALLASAGVDTAVIAPDSSVWAVFDNGLVAGTGKRWDSAVGSAAGRAGTPARARVSSDWEVSPRVTIITPNATDAPVSAAMADLAESYLCDVMQWQLAARYADEQVTRNTVRDALGSGSRLLYWVGHGFVVWVPGVGYANGLMLGTTYATRAMAQAAADSLLDDLKPTGADKRCVLWWDQDMAKYVVVILPAFVREYADFDHTGQANVMTRTMVCLTACYSAWGRPGELVQAFLDKGADVVAGYDWSVAQTWAAARDSAFFCDLADTCFPVEALRRMANEDPSTWRGYHASFMAYGDSLVRLQNVMRLKKDGTMYRAATAYGERVAGRSAVVSALRRQADARHSAPEIVDGFEVIYPGEGTGQFNTSADEGAMVTWIEMLSGRTFIAANNYVGVGCQIKVTKSTDDFLTGTVSGSVGYWSISQNPESVPPMQTLRLTDGCFKVTVLDSSLGRSAPATARAQP